MARVSLSWALILGLLAGIGPMCTDLYLPALPEMSEQLAATTTITQLTLTASLIGLGVGQLLFGPLSDKIGRKRPLILSLLLFIVSSILCATTNNIYWLVVWRFIQGIAGAGGSVLSRSIARDKYQGVTLTQFFALLMTVNGLAPVLSPVLGGYIVSTFDWRTLFWVMAEISTVLLLGCLLFINETLPENKRGSSLLLTGRSVVQNRRFMRFCRFKVLCWLVCLHISALRRSCCRRNLALVQCNLAWCLALTASDLSLLHGSSRAWRDGLTR